LASAIAAYNSGEGRLKKALRHSPGSGFFELKLPRETQRYVPQVSLAH
jgi:membrane-bound lytic murein transglycosylase D